jgi:Fe-S-cluster-containing hydrogenase component 2
MKRLFVDLDICSKCPQCVVDCSYIYHPHNRGFVALLEYADFAVICHQCDEAPCVHACYRDALEKQPDGYVKRYNLRCTSCKACTMACPFGVILPETIPYLANRCDFCLDKAEQPLCIKGCPLHAISWQEVGENKDEGVYLISDSLAVHAKLRFLRKEEPRKKKR